MISVAMIGVYKRYQFCERRRLNVEHETWVLDLSGYSVGDGCANSRDLIRVRA
jgi:hypothetical protein